MSKKKRFLKILVIVLLLILFLGYFAFSTFLFSPLEDDFDWDVAALIPRDVDFFVARADLEDAFDDFPRLALMDDLEEHEAWNEFETSPEYGDLKRELGVDEMLAAIATNIEQIPLGMEPQDIFGGRDVALAGYFKGRELAKADWAAYGRVNWVGKFGVELLGFPDLINLEAQGLSATKEGDLTRLEGSQLARPMFLTRIQDIVIVGTASELVQKAHDLAAVSGQDSFFQSARYNDHIARVEREREDAELFVDMRKMLETMEITKPLPDTGSEFFATAFLGRVLQLKSFKELTGVLGFHQGLELKIHGEVTSESTTPFQNRLYRQRGFTQQQAMEAARFAPEDCAFFVYLHGPVGDLVREIFASVEPALRANVDDAFRSTGKYEGLDGAIAELESAVKNRIVIFGRRNDYPPDKDGPPNDGKPVFTISVANWLTARESLDELRDAIGHNGGSFGLEGHEKDSPGYWKKKEAGWEIREFWSRFVPGTGVIASLTTGEVSVIANSFQMTGHVMKTYTQGGSRYPQLADRIDFQELLRRSLPNANVLVWIDPREMEDTLTAQAEQWAQDSFTIDYTLLRPEVERELMPELFPGRQKSDLTPEEIERLDVAVDPVLRQRSQNMRDQQVPILKERKLREITYMKSVNALMLMLKLDPKAMDLSLRVVTPLD